jgi:hypothetical protein
MTSHTGDLHDHLIQRERERHPVPVWVIYYKPEEFTGYSFAIRTWILRWPYTSMELTRLVAPMESLRRARRVIARASKNSAVRFLRDPTDPPAVVEAWLGESAGPEGPL